jgi:hypothetical protein
MNIDVKIEKKNNELRLREQKKPEVLRLELNWISGLVW